MESTSSLEKSYNRLCKIWITYAMDHNDTSSCDTRLVISSLSLHSLHTADCEKREPLRTDSRFMLWWRKHPLWPTEAAATFFPLFSSFLQRKLVSLSLVASRRSTKLHDNKETSNVDKDVFATHRLKNCEYLFVQSSETQSIALPNGSNGFVHLKMLAKTCQL